MHQEAIPHRTAETLVKSRSLVVDFLTGADDEFGRRRRCRCAEISYEVDDGEICLVAYG